MVLVFLSSLWIYCESSYLDRVFERLPQLEAYDADPDCSASMMYKLARTTPESAPTAYPARSNGVCEVKWVQANIDGQPIAYHSTRVWGYAKDVHKGDFLVTQTAFGRISSVLYPVTDLSDRVLFPRGILLPTNGNPVRKFEGVYMENFWILLFLTVVGSAILWRLWELLRNLPLV